MGPGIYPGSDWAGALCINNKYKVKQKYVENNVIMYF